MSHAKLAPSAAERWTKCTASPTASEGIPDTTSIHAVRGTILHDIAASQLQGENIHPEAGDTLRQEGHEYTITSDDMDAVKYYVDYVRWLANEAAKESGPGVSMHVEQKYDMRSFIPEGFGTSDAVILEPLATLTVADAKFGSGRVMADSLQLAIYALGVLDQYHPDNFFQKVKTVIVQPMLKHVDVHEYTIEELETIRTFVAGKAKEAFEGPGTFTPGDHCQWCPAKPCRAMVELAFSKVEDPTVSDDPKELAEQLKIVSVLEIFIKQVKAKSFAVMSAGAKLPGYKLVAGRNTRKWADEQKLVEYLDMFGVDQDTIFDTKIKSPAQLEKVLKGQDVELDGYIENVPGQPTIAPEKDRRKEIKPADLVFEKR